MRRVEEYKLNAKHCRALASLVTRTEDKVTLEEIAKAWEKVAAFRERDLHEPGIARQTELCFLANQLSRKVLSALDRLGCLSFRIAFASICRIRSRVTENCWPTSSSVWSLFMPRPKRMRTMRSSRGVSDARTRVVVSRRFDWIVASIGRIAFLSSIKSPRWASSSSPIGVSSESGSLAIFSVLRLRMGAKI